MARFSRGHCTEATTS